MPLWHTACLVILLMKPAKGRAAKRARTPHIDRLPEPARSIGRELLEKGVGPKSASKAEALAAREAEEWIASRAPTAQPMREHHPPKRTR